MEFCDIEAFKILFGPTERVCLVKLLNETSQNNTIIDKIMYNTIKHIT